MHEKLIFGGMVVDGTGSPPRRADVAINEGVVTAVGTGLGEGKIRIDANGCIVTPGFIDPHTHLDAHLFWDPQCAPSNLHGVTTVVLGNCGFGVAPCPAGGKEYMLRSLESVEEIPYSATSIAVPFNWNSWSEYADAVASLPLGVNVASYAAHSPLRYSVMGEAASQPGTGEESVRKMRDVLERALSDGAIGFASSRGPNHVDAFGRPVPSRNAEDEELQQLVSACNGRIWQINVKTKASVDARPLVDELERYVRWSKLAGASLTWTPLLVEAGSHWRQSVDWSRRRLEQGTQVVPQTLAMPLYTSLRFDQPQSYQLIVKGWLPVFSDWGQIDHAARVARLRSREVRDVLRAAGIRGTRYFDARFDQWEIVRSPTRPEMVGRTVIELASGGLEPVDALCDLLVADDLGTLLRVPVANHDPVEMADALNDDGLLYGLGDAGAHVTSITNYAYPTAVLSAFVRERGVLTVEKAVCAMTRRPARLLGIRDRGELLPGMAADICVIDLDRVAPGQIEVRADLPGGAERIYQAATGYRAVMVNGEVTVRDDVSLQAAAGRFLRR
jgi:N-acyl-D-amino-acid deacylase